MEQILEQRIRERAYALWLANGCTDGEAEQHWLAAEREVLAMLTAQAPPTATRKPRGRQTPAVAKVPAAKAR